MTPAIRPLGGFISTIRKGCEGAVGSQLNLESFSGRSEVYQDMLKKNFQLYLRSQLEDVAWGGWKIAALKLNEL